MLLKNSLRTFSIFTLALLSTITLNASAQPLQDTAMTDRIIVKYKANSSPMNGDRITRRAMRRMSNMMGGRNVRHLRQMSTGAQVMQLDGLYSEKDINAMTAALRNDPSIEYVEADRMMYPNFAPNDQFFLNQWHYYEPTGGLNLTDAWDISTGEGVVVAVIDTGITPHIELIDNLLPGYDMISSAFIAQDGNGRDNNPNDEGDFTRAGECGGGMPAFDQRSSWHGTHVAGTVAAVTDNDIGVAGVAFNAKVVPVRALGKCGGFTSDIADSIIWAAGGSVAGVPQNPNPAQVLNLSLGGGGACNNTSQQAVNIARNLGATVVVAAGNSNINVSNASPANCQGVVAVAATNRQGGKASYSNFGSLVDVAAPGGETGLRNADGVLSTLNAGSQGQAGDTLAFYQGTSMATPHVAGAVALLYALRPDITPAEVEDGLKETARPFPAACNQCGAGIVDATALLERFDGGDGGFVIPNIAGGQGSFQFTFIDIPAGTAQLTIEISGGSGDADLYVRLGSRPTTSQFNCRPFRDGNNEVCTFANPPEGRYHIGLRGFRAYSGVTLETAFNN